MRYPKTLACATIALLMTSAASAGARHLHMTDSMPKQDTTIAQSPGEIRVWFNQEVSLAVSRVGLEGPNGSVEMGRVQATDDPKSFKSAVGSQLGPGVYTVSWRTAGDDGHVQRGKYSFTMAVAQP